MEEKMKLISFLYNFPAFLPQFGNKTQKKKKTGEKSIISLLPVIQQFSTVLPFKDAVKNQFLRKCCF